MANTAAVYARIDPKLKKDVELILNELHIAPSALIQMLYAQIKLTKGIPFEIKIPTRTPLNIDEMSETEFNKELNKGLKDIEEGRTCSLDELNKKLKKKFDV